MSAAELSRQRILAWLLDWLIVFGASLLLGGLAWGLGAAYVLLRDGLFEGQSVGKRILGLRVVREPGKGPVGFAESALRNVLWILPVVNVVMGLTGLHYLINDPKGRHWGDRLANTRVITAKNSSMGSKLGRD